MYQLVLATQPCTLASTTGYRVYRLVLATQPCTLTSTTVYRVYRLVLARQPCTLASTTVHLLTECTNWYWLHSLVHLLQPTGYKSTNRVLATQSLLNNAASQLVTHKKKKKKKKAKYRPVAVKINWSPQPASFLPVTENCWLQLSTGYGVLVSDRVA